MESGARRKSALVAAAGLATTALLLTALPGESAQGAPAGTSATGSSRPGPLKTVTLVTGDQVRVDGAGKVAGVVRAEGRERVPFSVRMVDGHTRVVPGDAELLLAQGKLDARLFDVTQLVADGYDDAGRGDVPLIVTFKGKKAPSMSPFTGAGARMGRALPAVNGKAMRSVKKRGTDFWDTVTDTGADAFTASTAVERVWLDGRRRAVLDKSVPQIGAPTAWAAGYDGTGTGTRIAVLDTGVDTTHPDLANRVVAEQDFTGSESGTADKFGHGTHVASIAAGTGAGLPAGDGGTYKGVAPGAKLLNGKVLDDFGGGSDSGIIAGMEWAVAQGADVVNLSLGHLDMPGIDPLEETVNRLSAESDTLFVIAAGNEGTEGEFGEGTVGSPGSAEAALTVGAVDGADQLGDFSSRGPRVGDGGVKPDLTAPGAAVTAAAAAGSVLEGSKPSPAPGYITVGGTSMATPHVAGAAALLAQQHPDWTGERIKAVLTGSADPGAYSSFQQGTGRTDLVRALDQSVVTEQGPINFGAHRWPHNDDEPVTKQLTYENLGTEPVTLDLSVDAFSVDGKPAAEGMFAVSPQRLTVPAGGRASADVTADTRSGSADGTFGGSVSAVSADDEVAVRTAVGVRREVESFDLTLKHIDENGKPAGDAVTTVEGLDRDFYTSYADAEDGELTVRLPKGDYGLTGVVHPDFTSSTQAVLMRPKLTLDKDTTVTVDARQAQPLDITVPDTAAENTEATVAIRYERAAGMPKNTSGYWLPTFQGMRFGQLGPEVPAEAAFAQYSGDWTTRDDEGRPVTYHLSWDRRGDLGGFTAEVEREQLAEVDFQAGAPAAGKDVQVAASPHMPDGDLFGRYGLLTGRLPLRTTTYILDNGVKWSFAVQQSSGDGAFEYLLQGLPRTWQAGRSHTERFNVGVFGPALGGGAGSVGSVGSVATGKPGIERSGNVVTAFLPLFGDGAGHYDSGGGSASAERSLQVDGEEIPLRSSPANSITEFTVPDRAGAYRLILDNSRDPGLSTVSTRVRAEWTFRSAKTPEGEPTALPVSVIRFSPELSLDSTAKAGERFDVPFAVEGAAAGRQPAKLAFEVSYDEGATWRSAEAVDGTHLSLEHPAEPGSVSLRAELTDDSGNTLVQTIERAYLITK
ncbi:S8 family serine peptidase [Streptomyces akebiae]|uniref:S8 family serine peptidase n=1 Tax=Streptomyces akebiae TaxID=2865673 RepID=A0ABX8XUY7_9ACTN|nr:S8 family serine peptidase [Streptomyces akebiae]QYX79323.1 S8 family serine peptidase [Streptomyces akebiae]